MEGVTDDAAPPVNSRRNIPMGSAAARRGLLCACQGQGSLDQRAGAGRLDRCRAWPSPAMTRPMSFIEEAPVSAMICLDFGAGLRIVHLLGQEALDHRDLGLFPAASSSRLPLR